MFFKNEKLSGGKKSKERLTVLLTSNMDGSDKRKLFVGKSAKPRCFRGVKTLPVTYRSNSNAWMTSTLFQHWIESFDASLLKKGKKVCLLLDNCPALKIKDSALKCIELAYLPPTQLHLYSLLIKSLYKTLSIIIGGECYKRSCSQLKWRHHSNGSVSIFVCTQCNQFYECFLDGRFQGNNWKLLF